MEELVPTAVRRQSMLVVPVIALIIPFLLFPTKPGTLISGPSISISTTRAAPQNVCAGNLGHLQEDLETLLGPYRVWAQHGSRWQVFPLMDGIRHDPKSSMVPYLSGLRFRRSCRSLSIRFMRLLQNQLGNDLWGMVKTAHNPRVQGLKQWGFRAQIL